MPKKCQTILGQDKTAVSEIHGQEKHPHYSGYRSGVQYHRSGDYLRPNPIYSGSHCSITQCHDSGYGGFQHSQRSITKNNPIGTNKIHFGTRIGNTSIIGRRYYLGKMLQ